MSPVRAGREVEVAGPSALPAGTGALVLGTAVIGTSAILVELAGTAPSTVGAYRLGYAMVALWFLVGLECRVRGVRYGPRLLVPRPREGAAGVLFGTSVLLQNASIDLLGAGLATVLDNTHVIFLALGAWATTGRRPTGELVAAIALVTAGVGLVSWPATDQAAISGSGVALALLTAVAYAAYIALLPATDSGGGPTFPTLLPVCRIVTAAFPVAAVVAVVSEADLTPPGQAHAWMLALALGPQVVGWTLLTVGARAAPVVTTGLVLTLQPVFTVLLAMPVLGEWPSVRQGLGSTLVVLGVAVCTTRRRTPEVSSAAAPCTLSTSRVDPTTC